MKFFTHKVARGFIVFPRVLSLVVAVVYYQFPQILSLIDSTFIEPYATFFYFSTLFNRSPIRFLLFGTLLFKCDRGEKYLVGCNQ